jgi:hypothetical protein
MLLKDKEIIEMEGNLGMEQDQGSVYRVEEIFQLDDVPTC